MMKIHTIALRAALSAAFCFSALQVASAGTIIKLSLGSDAAADVGFAGGVLSTLADSNVPPTPGDQDTAVEFLDFLQSIPNIPANASFTLTGVTALPPATQVGTTIIQDFAGGQFQLWDVSGTLLLGVNLGTSQLTGNASPLPPTGAQFSTSFGSPIPGPGGGSLASQIAGNSVILTIGLGDVNGGAGFSLASLTPVFPGIFTGPLNNFTANATASIDANAAIPEPATAALFLIGLLYPFAGRRRNS